MKLEHWEPDLGTLMQRIDSHQLDLQPDFQRGLVWNLSKKRRLIDTILRGWSIPPVHLLVTDEERLVVLDGQQRLSAIRDFIMNQFSVESFAPRDPRVDSLANQSWSDLPDQTKRRFLNYTIPCYRLWDYTPDEPFELFFRLNLPTGLTQAEKRNALFGPTRHQVRDLVSRAEWSPESVGFANARMAYDDIVARCCCYVEELSLRRPLSTASLEDRYRDERGFDPSVTEIVARAIGDVREASNIHGSTTRFNKATLLSWVMAFARQSVDPRFDGIPLYGVLRPIEEARAEARRTRETKYIPGFDKVDGLLEMYTDRASLRVNDVLSIVVRDYAIWALATHFLATPVEHPSLAEKVYRGKSYGSLIDAIRMAEIEWGDLK